MKKIFCTLLLVFMLGVIFAPLASMEASSSGRVTIDKGDVTLELKKGDYDSGSGSTTPDKSKIFNKTPDNPKSEEAYGPGGNMVEVLNDNEKSKLGKLPATGGGNATAYTLTVLGGLTLLLYVCLRNKEETTAEERD